MDLSDVKPHDQSSKLNSEIQNEEQETSKSVEQLQKFLIERFDKKGILNDIRASLRTHIVNLIKDTQPACEMHYMQRLELSYQALNMLIAEYLLHLEFNYSLSVFAAEIPLSNMVFEFAKTLMKNKSEAIAELKFQEVDIRSILNYLGIKCDSEYEKSVLQKYQSEKDPLLLCILNTVAMYEKSVPLEQPNPSTHNISASEEGRGTEHSDSHKKCNHYISCKECRSQLLRFSKEYQMKNNSIKNDRDTYVIHLEDLLQTVDKMEENLADELFKNIIEVYDKEIENMKEEEEMRMKKVIFKQYCQLKMWKSGMEQSLHDRELKLERDVKEKKMFLWKMAKALREQYAHMRRAMDIVRSTLSRVSHQEENLKTDLNKAQQVFTTCGDQLRKDIFEDLRVITDKFEFIEKEQDSMHKERCELQQFTNLACHVLEVQKSFDWLKEQMSLLFKHFSKYEAKSFLDKGTLTDLSDFPKSDAVTNNVQELIQDEKEIRPHKRVMNNLKKPKNTNNIQEGISCKMYLPCSRSESPGERNERSLSEETHRLREIANQQQAQLEVLTQQQALLASELAAARQLAPPHHEVGNNLSSSDTPLPFSWHQGAGEELSVVRAPRPMARLPGDVLPFIGVVGRRQGMVRCNKLTGVFKRLSSQRTRKIRETNLGQIENQPLEVAPPNPNTPTTESPPPSFHYKKFMRSHERVKSPTSVLREAKQRLRHKDCVHDASHESSLDKSPSAVLRQAKRRLRKLEIEAKAVETYYRDFRNRREPRDYQKPCNSEETLKIDAQTPDEEKPSDEDLNFKSTKGVAELAAKIDDFLEKPMSEFRKLYHDYKSKRKSAGEQDSLKLSKAYLRYYNLHNDSKKLEATKADRLKDTDTKKRELEILKSNLSKIYNHPTDKISKPTELAIIAKAENIIARTSSESELQVLCIKIENAKKVLVDQKSKPNLKVIVSSELTELDDSSGDLLNYNTNLYDKSNVKITPESPIKKIDEEMKHSQETNKSINDVPGVKDADTNNCVLVTCDILSQIGVKENDAVLMNDNKNACSKNDVYFMTDYTGGDTVMSNAVIIDKIIDKTKIEVMNLENNSNFDVDLENAVKNYAYDFMVEVDADAENYVNFSDYSSYTTMSNFKSSEDENCT